jgi:hypothetical protein
MSETRVIAALSSGRFDIDRHADLRMRQRGIQRRDIVHAAWNYTLCVEIEPNKFEVEGPDEDGDLITVIATQDQGVLVVTVFGERERERS